MTPQSRPLRLDQMLVARGLAPSRSRAQALIAAGKVRVAGRRAEKPSDPVAPEAPILVDEPDHPWVSRGGVKLAAALESFAIDPAGKVVLDIGASTGGFTQVLLDGGADRVFAVDVGHGQMAPKLAADPRVTLLEKLNARHLTRDHVTMPVDLIVCDVSFIGLETALPASLNLVAAEATLVALIKPQFEAGAGRVGKGGIIRDPQLHQSICRRIADWIAARDGWHVDGIVPSPITGGDGNREFLIAARYRR